MTESDRDMTRLAAQAAGYDVEWHPVEKCFLHLNPTVRECGGWRLTFDPIQNEGDRYRLARDCQIRLDFRNRYALAFLAGTTKLFGWTEGNALEEGSAVVRAAAEIAKAQQGKKR